MSCPRKAKKTGENRPIWGGNWVWNRQVTPPRKSAINRGDSVRGNRDVPDGFRDERGVLLGGGVDHVTARRQAVELERAVLVGLDAGVVAQRDGAWFRP